MLFPTAPSTGGKYRTARSPTLSSSSLTTTETVEHLVSIDLLLLTSLLTFQRGRIGYHEQTYQ